jgi:hypothetical protein
MTFDSIHSCLYFFVYEYHWNYNSGDGRITVGDGVSPKRQKDSAGPLNTVLQKKQKNEVPS